MEYFGTSMDDHGHYRWNLDNEDRMEKVGITFSDLPFNPEELTQNIKNGNSIFYQGGGYTVIAIAGSIIDKRPNSKTVFWVKSIFSPGKMIEKIMQNKWAVKIINNFPYIIEWPLHY